jgi:hypothetical protein
MVGGPMPRRQVIRLAAAMLAGGFISTLWPSHVRAQNSACGTNNVSDHDSCTCDGGTCTGADDADACNLAMQKVSDTIAARACPPQCPVKQVGVIACNGTIHYQGTTTRYANGSYTCSCLCPQDQPCCGPGICCQVGQICCGGTRCCKQVSCSPTGVCAGGNPT